LLQHAHNPVDWWAWGPEAFAKAHSEDKPIFLSIGYSACHWCHVMERESFENEEVAAVLNRYFVPIKVDREERPDVDRIYMQFVQATTGSGGWPMSVWLTPDLKPFFGGTYFPPGNNYGRPGFKYLLEQLASAWQTDRSQILASSVDVLEQLKRIAAVSVDAASLIDPGVLESGFYQFRRSFDSRLGGFGGAPKFPRPVVHNFLLRYAWREKGSAAAEHEAAEMVLTTLREMAKGGMNDQLGGGFHRYSVDERWFVPHFEKMLYDQAQLAWSYIEAYQVSGDEALAQVARDIFEYVLREMTDAEGGFYSAEDADSVADPARPEEKREGAFYVWRAEELRRLLGDGVYDWFAYRYGVEPEGNVRNDPHGEFADGNILYQRHTVEETATRFGAAPNEVRSVLEGAGRKLMEARGTRVRPHLDDKVLTGWNGLMIAALAKGAVALEEPRYLEAAERAAWFVIDRMYDRGQNILLRRYRDGDAAIAAFLDDYAFFGLGLLELYQASFDERWLNFADLFARRLREVFEDTEGAGFYSTGAEDETLVLRMKEDYDGAEPSGNSGAILLLLRLAHITGNGEYRASAERALRAFSGRMRQMGSGMPQMLTACMQQMEPPRQVVLAGGAGEFGGWQAEFGRRFLPFHELLRADRESVVEQLRGMPAMEGKVTAYVCENFACNLPVNDRAAYVELLQ
jgi:uncharacterized protein YyaL (SSP411 family)